MPRFSLRTLMLAVLAVGVVIPAGMTGLEYRRFTRSKNASSDRMGTGGRSRDRANINAFADLTFANRHSSIIGFAGILHQSNGDYLLFVDWFSFKSDADSVLVTLNNGRTISCPLSETYGALESTSFDSDVYYHHQAFIDELGLVDGTEIKHVELGRGGTAISATVRPEEWIDRREYYDP